MKKLLLSTQNAPYALAAVITMSTIPQRAHAEGGIKEMAEGLIGDVGAVGQLIVAGGFLGGIVMLATGLMKLKQAAETQGQQVKYGEGLWRVAVGAGLIGLPAFASVLTQTFVGQDVNITPTGGATF